MFNTKYISLIITAVLFLGTIVCAHSDYEVVIGETGGQLILTEQPGMIALEYDALSGTYISDHVCWLSAEPLSSTSPTQPNWVIELESITLGAGLYALSEDYQQILDPDNFLLGEPVWEDGEGWHFHNHTLFGTSGGNVGDTFTATLRLVDTGGVYQSSDVFTLDFAIVPEPLTAMLFGCGACMLARRKR